MSVRRDATGTHRDEYLLTNDTALTADAVVGLCRGRWSIETTLKECRACLGQETTGGRCRAMVTRAAPCLFGLPTVVELAPDVRELLLSALFPTP